MNSISKETWDYLNEDLELRFYKEIIIKKYFWIIGNIHMGFLGIILLIGISLYLLFDEEVTNLMLPYFIGIVILLFFSFLMNLFFLGIRSYWFSFLKHVEINFIYNENNEKRKIIDKNRDFLELELANLRDIHSKINPGTSVILQQIKESCEIEIKKIATYLNY